MQAVTHLLSQQIIKEYNQRQNVQIPSPKREDITTVTTTDGKRKKQPHATEIETAIDTITAAQEQGKKPHQ